MVKTLIGTVLAGFWSLSTAASQPASKTKEPDFAQAIKKLNVDYAKGSRDFSLEFTSVAGKWVEGVPESESRLKVDGQGKAELFRRAPLGDSPEYPPGEFTGKIPDSLMRELLGLLEKGPFKTQARELFGPWDPIDRLTVRAGKQSFSFALGTSREPPPEAMEKVFNMLVDWTFHACPVVLWSLNLKADRLVLQKGKLSARIKVENSGPVPVRILHPLSRSSRAGFGLRLRYGERQLIEEGYTPEPIDFKFSTLDAPTLDSLKWVEVSKGNPFVLETTLKLEGSAARGWTGTFTFDHRVQPDSSKKTHAFSGMLTSGELIW